MKVQDFRACGDIVGRRIRISWQFIPDPGESLADIPPVRLRRKLRDYAFPAPAGADPYSVYESAAFPPAPVAGALAVVDLDSWEERRDGARIVYEPISVSAPLPDGGRFVEIFRRTVATVFDGAGAARRQRVEILDTGGRLGALVANGVYYYQLFSLDLPASGDEAAPYRATAMATDSYGHNRALYQALPEIYRRHDANVRPDGPGSDTVPEMAPHFGQLRRFVDIFGIGLDALRGGAEGLRGLHDLARVDAKFLGAIAHWIGWDLGGTIEIPLLRNELLASSRLYPCVGGLPGLRALVAQYTGWTTQVAEFAQNIALANQPPQRNLLVFAPEAGGADWRGFDDVAETLGFPALNQTAAGAPGAAATLTGLAVEPFRLRAGATLTLATDGGAPASIRFGAADFADMSKATAREVAAAIERALSEVKARALGGALALSSETVGAQSLLQILPAPTSLLSLESAPEGRLATTTDSLGRARLFYEAWDTPTAPSPDTAARAALHVAAGAAGANARRRIRYKTFVDGLWRDSQPVYPQGATPQADPAAVALPDDRIFCAWIEAPQCGGARLRWSLGAARPAWPARLLGGRSEPFVLSDGGKIAFVGRGWGVRLFTVHAADFADLAKATAAELAAAVNGQINVIVAARRNDGSIGFATRASGDAATLAIDLARSTCARAVGFDAGNCAGAPGGWDDRIDWRDPLDAVSIPPGRHAELCAVADPAGGVRLAWSCWRDGRFHIRSAHWRDRVIAATADGAYLRRGDGAWSRIAGLASADVRAVKSDACGVVWIATGAGLARMTPDGLVAPVAPPPPANDIRDIAFAPGGAIWLATPAGALRRDPGGAVSQITTSTDFPPDKAHLPSNDIRALAVDALGAVWFATAGGAAALSANGWMRSLRAGDGLPSDDIRDIAVDGRGAVYLATPAGLAIVAREGGICVVDAASGLPSSDIRAVAVAADGAVWVAGAAGVSQRPGPGSPWRHFGLQAGLNSLDALSVAVAPDGGCWVGTAAGFNLIAADFSVTAVDLLHGGGANPAGRAIHAGWSEALELASAGDSNREPVLAVDAQKAVWLAWARQTGAAGGRPDWLLQARICSAAQMAWGPQTYPLTAPSGPGGARDRTPALLALPGAMRLYFASDRNGGYSLWSLDVALNGAAGTPAPLPEHRSSDLWPCPASLDGTPCVIYRGDANVSLALAGLSPSAATPTRSRRAPDNGAARRFSGSVAVDLADGDRIAGRRAFGDLLSYTPNRPDGAGAPTSDEYYTRGAIGLYVTRALRGADLTRQEADRLDEMLKRFLPINLRALVILVEPTDVEIVYPPGAAPQDSYRDDYPHVSIADPIVDSSAVAMPGLSTLHANIVSDVSADPADPTTLRRRSYFPPLQ